MAILLLRFFKFPVSGITWVCENIVHHCLFCKNNYSRSCLMRKAGRKILLNPQCSHIRKEGFILFCFFFKMVLWLWNQHAVIWGWFSSWPLNTWKTSLLALYFLCVPCITVTHPPKVQQELQSSHSSRIQSLLTWILCCRYFIVATSLYLFCGH